MSRSDAPYKACDGINQNKSCTNSGSGAGVGPARKKYDGRKKYPPTRSRQA